jgi:hypothetical protein
MPRPPRVISLDEIEAIPGPGTLTWRPVRHALGIRAFGCNAYTAEEAGRDVVESHTEDPKLAHEELYFVARGRATFTIDEQTYDAPSGTFVFVPDPASYRHAVAAEPGTAVLSFGGPATFEPSGWEWSFRAAQHRDSDRPRAREILEEGIRSHPESARLHYDLASVDSLDKRTEQATASLRRAIELRPALRAEAAKDDAFETLHHDPVFRALIGV